MLACWFNIKQKKREEKRKEEKKTHGEKVEAHIYRMPVRKISKGNSKQRGVCVMHKDRSRQIACNGKDTSPHSHTHTNTLIDKCMQSIVCHIKSWQINRHKDRNWDKHG